MKKYLIPLLIAVLIFPSSCAKSPSTMELMKQRKGPIQGMRLPERDVRTAESETIEIRRGDELDAPPDLDTEKETRIDLKALEKIPEHPVTRRIRVSGNNVPLRKGPGSRFDKVGVGSKGDMFTLLRIERSTEDDQKWYLVENDQNEKFFISSLFSTIFEEPLETREESLASKKVLQKSKKVSLNKLKTVIDPSPPLPEDLKKAKHITLNFEGTELYDVITTFAELLQIDYVIEGNVQGKVTLQTFSKIPVEDLYSVLEQILALNNVTVVRSGHFYRFLPIQDAGRKPLSIHYGDDPQVPDEERLIIQIIPLKYISVESMKKIIAPLLTKNASFIEVPETNNLMMIELAFNAKRIVNVVQALDIDKLATSDIQLYQLNNSDAEVVVSELQEIFSSMGYADAIGDSLTFLPLPRLNSVMVVNAYESILPTIEFWMGKLDQPISEGKVSTFVYYVQNGDAEQLAGLLNGMFESQRSLSRESSAPGFKKTSAKPGKDTDKEKKTDQKTKTESKVKVEGGIEQDLEGEVMIIPDKDTNALVIRTSPRNYPAILEVIKKLDLLPQQVLIEVLIIDLTVDEETREGLEWIFQSSAGSAEVTGGLLKTGSTLGSTLGTATASLVPGGSFFVTSPDDLIVKIQAFASDSKAKILANPILVASDNKAANISVTDEIPIVSSTLTTNTTEPVTTTTVEFRSVGVKLDILPKINSDNFVNMKITQEISNRSTDVITGETVTPSFNTRLVNTEVVLKDNQVLVMGGLMRNNVTETVEGLPYLKDIPYIGKLFSNTTIITGKTELMLFITPHIISTTEDSQFVTREFEKRLGDLRRFIPKARS